MQFFIALGILVVTSSAYLLHQFWSRTLTADDAHQLDSSPAEETLPSHLKAA